MTLQFLGEDNVPTYLALSTDIVDNKITGASLIGKTIYLTDTHFSKIILKDLTLGDYSQGSGGGVTRSGNTADGHLAVWNGVNADSIKDGGSFTSLLWNQSINESGASFSNFTSSVGTWLSQSGVIKQTETTASYKRAKYNNLVVISHMIYEAEIQIKNAGSERIAGLIVGYDGTNGGGMVVRLNQSGQVQVESDGAAAIFSVNHTINIDTWYKLRMYVSGGNVSFFLDDVLLGTSGNNATRSGDASYVGLLSYQTEAWFRNIKAWNLITP